MKTSTADFLETIMASKRKRVGALSAEITERELRAKALSVRQNASPHRLREGLQQGERLNIIAEIKRASPSKGMIQADVSPAAVAQKYEAGGAAAISVLTEEDYFQGSLDDLREVRRAVRLPILRKDFIFDSFQIYEAAAAGADAVLLIVAALETENMLHLRRVAEEELGMDALVEVHTRDELRQALDCGATLVGVNNRDLRTFQVSLDVSIDLISEAPQTITLISESGLRNHTDLSRLHALGFHGFLIGESLMRAPDAEEALRQLLYGTGGQGQDK